MTECVCVCVFRFICVLCTNACQIVAHVEYLGGIIDDLAFLCIYAGPLWIVLVADADGFVPLTFKHQEELTVRSAKRKCLFKSSSGSNEQPLEKSANIEQ